MGFYMTSVCCVFAKETEGCRSLPFWTLYVHTGKTWYKTIVLFLSSRMQAYMYICSLPWYEADWILRLFHAIRKFVYREINGSSGGMRAVSFFFSRFFFSAKSSFPVIRASVNVGCRFCKSWRRDIE